MTEISTDVMVPAMNTQTAINFCPSCGAPAAGSARFCSGCGKNLIIAKPQVTAMGIGLTLLLGAVIWALGWNTQDALIGSRPTQEFEASASTKNGMPKGHEQFEAAIDPEIEKLAKDVVAAKDDPTKLTSISDALVTRYRSTEAPSPSGAIQLIEAFGAILKADPNNKSALVGMADVSFDQQTFEKAVPFYERYLKLVPGDDQVRQRYAASLTFVGRFKDSINELTQVLKKDPKSFSATAYLAIAYAEDGQEKKAIELGDKAMALAPSKEAKERFETFLKQVKNPGAPQADTTNVRGNVETADAAQNASTSSTSTQDNTAAIEAAIKQSPVAGPKFTKSEKKSDGTLALYFDAFPMDQMPPFAKEKFLSKLRDIGASSDVKKLAFIDAATGKEMDSLVLSK